MTPRPTALMIGMLLCAGGCTSSIEGTVYGTDGDNPVRITGHPVFLLAAASDVASVLKSICPASPADWAERSRAERARFEGIAFAYADSAREELALHRSSRRWGALVRTMNLYRDSATAMDGRPPTVPAELIEKLAMNRVNTADDGHYAFPKLSPGTYLVATELRDEVRWVPVQVARGKTVADVTPRRSHASCDVARQL